jgi:hypothetical protein
MYLFLFPNKSHGIHKYSFLGVDCTICDFSYFFRLMFTNSCFGVMICLYCVWIFTLHLKNDLAVSMHTSNRFSKTSGNFPKIFGHFPKIFGNFPKAQYYHLTYYCIFDLDSYALFVL